MNSTTNFIEEQIAELEDELRERQGETLAVQAWDLIGYKRRITERELERARLVGANK